MGAVGKVSWALGKDGGLGLRGLGASCYGLNTWACQAIIAENIIKVNQHLIGGTVLYKESITGNI